MKPITSKTSEYFSNPYFFYELAYGEGLKCLDLMQKSGLDSFIISNRYKLVIEENKNSFGTTKVLKLIGKNFNKKDFPDLTGGQIPLSDINHSIENQKPYKGARNLDYVLEKFMEVLDKFIQNKRPQEDTDQTNNQIVPFYLILQIRDAKEYLSKVEYRSFINLSLKNIFSHIPTNERENYIHQFFDKYSTISFIRDEIDETFQESLLTIPYIEFNHNPSNIFDLINYDDFSKWIWNESRHYASEILTIFFIHIIKQMIQSNINQIPIPNNLGTLILKSYSSTSQNPIQYGLILDNGLLLEVSGLNDKIRIEGNSVRMDKSTPLSDYGHLFIETNNPIVGIISQLKRSIDKHSIEVNDRSNNYCDIVLGNFQHLVLNTQAFEQIDDLVQYINHYLKKRYGELLNFNSGFFGPYLIQEIRIIHVIFLELLNYYNPELINKISPFDVLTTK